MCRRSTRADGLLKEETRSLLQPNPSPLTPHQELLVLLANMCHLFSWSTADGKPCPQSVLQVMRIKPQRTKLLFTKRRDVGALIAAQE